MKKKDVLKILTGKEATKALKTYPAYITRMGKDVPKEHQKTLINACKRKLINLNNALKRITGDTK